jgi:hypothetical protein
MKSIKLSFKCFQALAIKFGGFVRVQKLFSIIVLASVLASAFPIAAQTQAPVNRGSQGGSRQSKVPIVSGGAVCKGGWSGVINFESKLDESRTWKSPGSANGHSSEEFSHNISYKGTMIVDGSDPKAVVARGTVGFSDVWLQHENSVTIDSCHANETHEFVVDDKANYTETGNGAGKAESFYLYLDEMKGTYNLSFSFPKVPGKSSRENHRRASGHCQPKNNEPIDRIENKDIVIESKGGSVENYKIDLNEPEVLEGTKAIVRDNLKDANSNKTHITTFSWYLRRCPPPLLITDVKFYHPRYPSPSTWEEISEDGYTIDGNDVKIAATIVNLSGARKSATVNFKELKENADLPQGQINAEFEPHEARTVEYVWNTSGYAWREASPVNQPEIFRQIEVKIPDDRKTEEIEVRPKPVIVVPGIWAEDDSYRQFKNYFAATSDKWSVSLAKIDADKISTDNAAALDQFIREKQTKHNAWHVDLVAHFSGGLTARVYVNSLMPTLYDGRPAATHLILVGVPNLGTPCSTGVWGAAIKLNTLNLDVIAEMSPDAMSKFNLLVVNTNGTRFAAIAGNSWESICSEDVSGDKVVPKASAVWRIRENFVSSAPVHNRQLLGDVGNYRQIYKWFAVPPKGNHAPDTAGLQQ